MSTRAYTVTVVLEGEDAEAPRSWHRMSSALVRAAAHCVVHGLPDPGNGRTVRQDIPGVRQLRIHGVGDLEPRVVRLAVRWHTPYADGANIVEVTWPFVGDDVRQAIARDLRLEAGQVTVDDMDYADDADARGVPE